MARTSKIVKFARSRRNPKFSTRRKNCCWKCGRPNAYIRDLDLCRICFRELADQGLIPGITKASW